MARKKVTEETVPETTSEIVETPVVEEAPKTKKRASKKKVEEPVVEEVPAAEPTVEEILTPSAEEVQAVNDYFEKLDSETAEPPIVFESCELVVEKPKKAKKIKEAKVEEPAPVEEAKVEEPKTELPYRAKVSASIIHARKGPGMSFHTARDLYNGTLVVITEVDGNWGKIGKDLWVNINYVEKV